MTLIICIYACPVMFARMLLQQQRLASCRRTNWGWAGLGIIHAQMHPCGLAQAELSCMVPCRRIIDDLHYGLSPGERLGLVGPNGAGKSTLLRLIAGQQPLAAGHRDQGETVVVGQLTQEPMQTGEHETILSHIQCALCLDPCLEAVNREKPHRRDACVEGPQVAGDSCEATGAVRAHKTVPSHVPCALRLLPLARSHIAAA